MEPLYPQNILERTFPILRERREKAEREALQEGGSRKSEEEAVGKEEELYARLPYEGGPAGKNLNTLA